MKLRFAPVLVAIAFITGAPGPGPAEDSLISRLSSREEISRMRAEIVELRSGRGSAAPDWVAKYAAALCAEDATFVAEHSEPSLGVSEEDIAAQFARMHANGLECTSVRYLGSVGDRQYVFVLRHGAKDTWYILTVSDDGQTIAKVG
jgi:hypothetical protein